MSSRVRGHVFKLRTSGSPEENILIYLLELISSSVLENQLTTFLSVIYMMESGYT